MDRIKEKEFVQMRSVFSSLFSINSESAFLFWHGIPIRFHYAYELYANFEDLLKWWEKLAFQSKGGYEFVLNTDIFLTEIKSHWFKGNLRIESDWMVKRSHGALAAILNQKGPIDINIFDFLREWKVILYQIVNSIKKARIDITDAQEKEKIQRLIRIVNRIEGQGVLYTKSGDAV